MRPDKAKVVDEIWDDKRIEDFLAKPPMGAESADFSRLLNAYRSMRVEDFARFVVLYKAQGGELTAVDQMGRSLAQVIGTHDKSAPFLEILTA